MSKISKSIKTESSYLLITQGWGSEWQKSKLGNDCHTYELSLRDYVKLDCGNE
jgi:hypothetical protein